MLLVMVLVTAVLHIVLPAAWQLLTSIVAAEERPHTSTQPTHGTTSTMSLIPLWLTTGNTQRAATRTTCKGLSAIPSIMLGLPAAGKHGELAPDGLKAVWRGQAPRIGWQSRKVQVHTWSHGLRVLLLQLMWQRRRRERCLAGLTCGC